MSNKLTADNDLMIVLSDGRTYDRSATVSKVPEWWPDSVVDDSLRASEPGTVTVRELVQALRKMAAVLDKPDEIRDRIYEQIDLLNRLDHE